LAGQKSFIDELQVVTTTRDDEFRERHWSFRVGNNLLSSRWNNFAEQRLTGPWRSRLYKLRLGTHRARKGDRAKNCQPQSLVKSCQPQALHHRLHQQPSGL
jgi:hypothetical protein